MVKVGRAVIESAAIGDSGLPPDQWRDQKLQHCRRRMRVPKAALTARKTRNLNSVVLRHSGRHRVARKRLRSYQPHAAMSGVLPVSRPA